MQNPAGYTQQWVPVQTVAPQGSPGYWQQFPQPPPVVVPGPQGPIGGGGYVPSRKSRNLVNQVKALLTQASAGQLLDIAKHASAELRQKNPSLHLELVKAVTGGVPVPLAQAKEQKAGDASEIQRRKAMWREKCEATNVVAYRESVIAEIQKQHGTKAAADELVCDMPDVDLKRYMQGKKKRELLLAECGLGREGADLVLLPDWTDPSCKDSLCGEPNQEEDGDAFVTKSDFAAMQSALLSLTALVTQISKAEAPQGGPAPVKKPDPPRQPPVKALEAKEPDKTG